MGMREKLIKLLVNLTDRLGCQLVGYSLAMKIADRLIANGVTIPVRCKDCKKWHRHTEVDRERGECRRYQTTKHETGFCDRGERRTDDI